VTLAAIDHVQLAGPPGCEDDARRFYGRLLGLEEIEKPEPMRASGGAWFRIGGQELHIGIEGYPGVRRFYTADPFGNRIEILAG
jgi:catechol 2,3-dioxygenase-like lactoylglutathione lyase family enzyme